ncbi:PAAR domain-containing protein [Pseudomonas sp. GZD-222]|uniref:PAAR domain-containing protein n=1 Tax=Pseudomonas sp. GZD-222 TaxID=3404805 RepID=UPI003BB50DDF
MATGHFIRLGDKTTCGGTVLEADQRVVMFGRDHVREGDRVTCGKDGSVYRILGGISYIESHGRRVAGSLDSISSCPCQARLIPSLDSATYHSEQATPTTAHSPSPGVTAMPLAARPPPVVDSPLEEEEEEEELEEVGIVLRLGLFFDGTGNNQANSAATADCYAASVGLTTETAEDIRQHCAAFGFDGDGNSPDNSYGNDVSNVARLYNLYPDQAEEQLPPGAEEAYIKVYLEGIGTSSGLGDSLYSQGTGQGSTGVVARVEQAPALVMEQLRRFRATNPQVKVRRIEVDLFGFSRGAAAARHCANDLLKGSGSLLARSLAAGSPLLTSDFAWRHRSDFALNFIGLFDTVAGIVSLRNRDFSPHNAANPGLNLRLAPGIARKVVHLAADNEYRHNFSLTQAEQDIMLPGCHSDIGGGYLPLSREKLLLSKPDSSVEFNGLPNERSAAYARTKQRFSHESRHWLAYVSPEGLDIVTWSVQTQQRKRDTQAEKRVYAAIVSQRQVRNELSLVYLRIMREWGVRAGVAFKVIPSTAALAIPVELQPIAAKLQAFALGEPYTSLTSEEYSLLRRRYIHLSAHWNAAKGWNNSALDVVFINRPAAGIQRMEHPNE